MAPDKTKQENYFSELSQQIFARLRGSEVLLLNYESEQSDFVRFNKARIRQAGQVLQQQIHMDLVDSGRETRVAFNLCGEFAQDLAQAGVMLDSMREQLPLLPQDPYIHYAQDIHNSSYSSDQELPASGEMTSSIVELATGLDLVGILASGTLFFGFANSLGQRNWYSDRNVNLDWSVYSQGDKAVKQNYAGAQWDRDTLKHKLEFARQTLPLLERPAKTISPGQYRAFLAPAALHEIMGLLNWGGFGLKSHRTQQTPLIRMTRDNVRLDSRVSLTERHDQGFAPLFTRQGFKKPAQVSLIREGVYQDCLANPRSAREYAVEVNCDIEHPCSLVMETGTLSSKDVLSQLGTGVYISNLWYGNYSDRNHCRITGMTRFACMWVENGEPVSPLNVMRFDESVLDLLGDKLIAITSDSEHMLDPATYEHRSNSSMRLPGILVDGLTFTL
ncbi:MAG: metallopeptidase TldD-related protein [Gammaproteobacteria bacterium]|nr:metallopeptidase TldD-related protein [Gammaproteobacteria bacterium]